ncbi:hypothetical protein [Cytobacillus oceanisediminis]|uniref:hypothetical protein n=1 Tax=Cytobacillus oceanisediminis TaxID=665099 RepID=UPI003735A755
MEKNSQPQVINAEKLLRHWLGAMKFRLRLPFPEQRAILLHLMPVTASGRRSKLYFTYRNCYKTAVQRLPVRREGSIEIFEGQ